MLFFSQCLTFSFFLLMYFLPLKLSLCVEFNKEACLTMNNNAPNFLCRMIKYNTIWCKLYCGHNYFEPLNVKIPNFLQKLCSLDRKKLRHDPGHHIAACRYNLIWILSPCDRDLYIINPQNLSGLSSGQQQHNGYQSWKESYNSWGWKIRKGKFHPQILSLL